MKCLLSMVIAMLVGMQVSGAVALSNVKIQQRYPWNGKVDISFNLASTRASNSLHVNVLDTSTGTSLVAGTFYDENGNPISISDKFANGRHRLVWDAAADLSPRYKTDSLAISIVAGPYYDYPEYLVIDISGGTSTDRFPIMYLDKIPDGGWTEEYRTSKIVLKLIQPGSFIEGPDDNCSGHLDFSRRVTLTRPYYFGIYRITQGQWNLIMGDNRYTSDDPSLTASDLLVLDVRGTEKSLQWPMSDEVDDGCFIDIVRKKTSLRFDMPTEAQWEYAARAGTMDNSPPPSPNAWGLYEFGLTVSSGTSRECQGEWCIDWWSFFTSSDPVVDPKGPVANPSRDLPSVVRCSVKGRYTGKTGVNNRMEQLNYHMGNYTELGFRLSLTK